MSFPGIVSSLLTSGPAQAPTAAAPTMNQGSFVENLGGLLGRAVTGGSPTGDAIGTLLGTVAGTVVGGLGGSDMPGRSNVPVTAMPFVVAPMAGMAGRALMTGMGMAAAAGIMGRLGRGVSRQLRRLVPVVGLEVAASILGLTLPQAAMAFTRRRRRRGISAADVRRTYRTLNFVAGVQRRLSQSRICKKR